MEESNDTPQVTPEVSQSEHSHLVIPIALLVLVILVLGGWVLINKSKLLTSISDTSDNQLTQTEEEDDELAVIDTDIHALIVQDFYREGDELYRQGDIEGARAFYNSVAGDTPSGDILIEHAAYRNALTQPTLAGVVDELIILAFIDEYSEATRALAFETIGYLYEHAGSDAEKATIISTLFAQSPLSSFRVADDDATSLINFYEYASTFGPSPYADAHVVASYMGELSTLLEQEGTSDVRLAGYGEAIETKLAGANVSFDETLLLTEYASDIRAKHDTVARDFDQVKSQIPEVLDSLEE